MLEAINNKAAAEQTHNTIDSTVDRRNDDACESAEGKCLNATSCSRQALGTDSSGVRRCFIVQRAPLPRRKIMQIVGDTVQ
jgi:hypothetical protein